MINTERNTALAVLFGPEGYGATGKCPQGHGYGTMTHKGIRTNICWDCLVHSEVNAKELEAHYDDSTWHPEWRIQSAPKDFTAPGVLEPLARELVARWGEEDGLIYGWDAEYAPEYEDISYRVELSGLFRGGMGATYEIALGEALLDAARNR